MRRRYYPFVVVYEYVDPKIGFATPHKKPDYTKMHSIVIWDDFYQIVYKVKALYDKGIQVSGIYLHMDMTNRSMPYEYRWKEVEMNG